MLLDVIARMVRERWHGARRRSRDKAENTARGVVSATRLLCERDRITPSMARPEESVVLAASFRRLVDALSST